MRTERDYDELQSELKAIEEKLGCGFYLCDTNIDAENAGVPRSDPEFFSLCYSAAIMAAGMRAEEYGLDINVLIGRPIY